MPERAGMTLGGRGLQSDRPVVQGRVDDFLGSQGSASRWIEDEITRGGVRDARLEEIDKGIRLHLGRAFSVHDSPDKFD